MKKFLSTKGYYLVLLLCVAVVCVGGAYALRNNSNKDNDVLSNATEAPTKSPGDVPVIGNDPVIKPVTPTPGNSTPTPVVTPEPVKMIKPLEGDIKVEYAMTKLIYNETIKEWRTHSGIDIAGNLGAEVKCAAAGKVKDLKNDPLLGPTAIVEHAGGVVSYYSGLQDTSKLTIGQTLAQGDVVGLLGDTVFVERDEGPHLHFEVEVNGNTVDPVTLFS
ncbi:MAG: M23 family metallopeptidase [Clostridiales bacterium]|jgi:murein DD-endopeptidase MepM/ murein hydrolase activator NlpD|nr:M23 family metallopeptidase [Clostridiales bacterium]